MCMIDCWETLLWRRGAGKREHWTTRRLVMSDDWWLVGWPYCDCKRHAALDWNVAAPVAGITRPATAAVIRSCHVTGKGGSVWQCLVVMYRLDPRLEPGPTWNSAWKRYLQRGRLASCMHAGFSQGGWLISLDPAYLALLGVVSGRMQHGRQPATNSGKTTPALGQQPPDSADFMCVISGDTTCKRKTSTERLQVCRIL